MVTRSAAGWIVVGTVVVVVLVVGFVYREQLEFWILQRADDRQDPGTSDGEPKRDSPR